MTDPGLPSDDAHADLDTDRGAKIEALLLSGLDHYFSSDYEQAIDIWTRALFLDRGHARARAYIERARSALAEQQRESEELLHNGIAAFERGEIEAARQLLNAAVQRVGAHEVALAFLTRIDRINAAAPGVAAPVVRRVRLPFRADVAPAVRRGPRVLTALFGVAAVAMAAYALGSWDQVRALAPLLGSATEAGLAPVMTTQDPVQVPRSSEGAMERARALFAAGRPYDALRAVDLVRPTDPLRGEADRLKAAIQRELLAHHTPPGGIDPSAPANTGDSTAQ